MQQPGIIGITRKDTILVNNSPTLWRMARDDIVLESTGLVLRGLVTYQGQRVMKTKLSQTYPPQLGEDYGVYHEEALNLREDALAAGAPIPHALKRHNAGLPSLWHSTEMEAECIEWDLAHGPPRQRCTQRFVSS